MFSKYFLIIIWRNRLMFFTAKSIVCSNLSHHERPQNRSRNFNDWHTVLDYPTTFPQQQTQGK